MLAMSDVNCIKKLRNEKGLSISEIQRVMKINWRTAKKYADEEQLQQPKLFEKKGMINEMGLALMAVNLRKFALPTTDEYK